MSEKVLKCLYAAIDEANQDRLDLPPLEKSPDTRISGTGADGTDIDEGLDSLGLINFLVAVEEEVEREFDIAITLSDDEILSREPSPLGSVGSLEEYIEELLGERQG